MTEDTTSKDNLLSIAQDLNMADEEDSQTAMERTAKLPDTELYLYAYLTQDTATTTKAKALAQCEIARRSQRLTEELTKKTTRWSTCVGAIAVIAGAIFGAMATLIAG